MTAKQYILERLKGIKSKTIKPETKLADLIFAAVMSKKFRKFSVSPETQNKIRAAIELNIKNNEPIKFAIPFGSYKLWRFQESPEVDWAELFSMIYYAYWLSPITDVYMPGVCFDFCADDAILELLDNIPSEDTERYKQGFRALIKFIQPYLPGNFQYTFSPVAERYDSKEAFLADLNIKIEELRQKNLPPLTEQQIEMMKFNVKLKTGEELNFEKNRLLHDAYMNVSKRRTYHKTPDKIQVSSTPWGNSIPVGTTKTSVVRFQTGVGILKKTKDGFIEYIYSPSQLEKSKFNWQEIAIKGLSGKNFKRIRIINN